MQLAMYQMLTNFASNSPPIAAAQPLSIRSLNDHHHSKPLKRLAHHKRPRLAKTTSE